MNMTWSDIAPEDATLLLSWPTIALIKGPTVAKLLGVRPSTLRNWRHRGQGPSPEPCQRQRGGPKPVYYRVSEVLAWLDGVTALAPWERDRAWLVEHLKHWRFCDEEGFVDVVPDMTCQQTERVTRAVRQNVSDRFFVDAAGIEEWPSLRH